MNEKKCYNFLRASLNVDANIVDCSMYMYIYHQSNLDTAWL